VSEPSTVQLQQWLDRLAEGDKTAGHQLVDLTYDRLTALTRRMFNDFPRLKKDGDATEVLHDSLLRLMSALDAVRPRTAREFYGLAALQIRRVLLDMARKPPQPTTFGQDDQNVRLKGPDTNDPRRLAIWTEFHRQVDALPTEDRELADLLYYQELSQDQVAEILGVDKSTVKRRWRAVRQKLRTVVKGLLPGI
jgi:RNA polymerase sigma factor (sigma-70 family)